jgi:tetratricopeptide (TPR) repeat protein
MAALANALLLVPGDEAAVLAEEAEELAHQHGDSLARAVALNGWAWSLRARGREVELRRVATIGVEHAVASGRADWESTIRYLLAVALVEAGELDEGAAEFERHGAVRSVIEGWAPAVFGASRAVAEGRLDEGETLIARADELGSALGDTNDVIRSGQSVTLELARGRYDEAMAAVERLEMSPLGIALGWRMLVLAESGELEAAAFALEAYERDVRPLVPGIVGPWWLEAEVSVAYRTGDRDLAASLRDQVASYAGSILGADTVLFGAGEYLIGRIAFVEGRYDDAVAGAEHAIGFADRWSLALLSAKHRIDLVRALLARDSAGDANAARNVLAEALETSDRLGLGGPAAEARELLA